MSESSRAIGGTPHYSGDGAECIDFARHMTFNLGNAFKYVWRLGRKDDESQEISKALDYLAWEIELAESRPTKWYTAMAIMNGVDQARLVENDLPSELDVCLTHILRAHNSKHSKNAYIGYLKKADTYLKFKLKLISG